MGSDTCSVYTNNAIKINAENNVGWYFEFLEDCIQSTYSRSQKRKTVCKLTTNFIN